MQPINATTINVKNTEGSILFHLLQNESNILNGNNAVPQGLTVDETNFDENPNFQSSSIQRLSNFTSRRFETSQGTNSTKFGGDQDTYFKSSKYLSYNCCFLF